MCIIMSYTLWVIVQHLTTAFLLWITFWKVAMQPWITMPNCFNLSYPRRKFSPGTCTTVGKHHASGYTSLVPSLSLLPCTIFYVWPLTHLRKVEGEPGTFFHVYDLTLHLDRRHDLYYTCNNQVYVALTLKRTWWMWQLRHRAIELGMGES